MAEELDITPKKEAPLFASEDKASASMNEAILDDNDDAQGIPSDNRPFRPRRRRKVSYLTINKIESVDYKDVATLKRFINDNGKITPARQNGNSASQQRMIAQAIKRAREIALLPFVIDEFSTEFKRPQRPRQFTPREGSREYGRGGYRSNFSQRSSEEASPEAGQASEASKDKDATSSSPPLE